MNEIFQHISGVGFAEKLTIDIIFFRLLLAVIFGGIVGLERERRHRPAGFRTHILVCLGAAIVSMVQDQLRIDIVDYAQNNTLAEVIKTDLGRLGAQVVSGIGFLGAGCIIRDKGSSIVTGMTTAAGIWATGCMGLGIGWGFYNIAIPTIVIMLIVMIGLKRFEDKFIRKDKNIHFEVKVNSVECMEEVLFSCYQLFEKNNMNIVEIDKSIENNIFSVVAENVTNSSLIIAKISSDSKVQYVKEI